MIHVSETELATLKKFNSLKGMFTFLTDRGVSVELAELIVELADAVRRISQDIVTTSMDKVDSHNSFGEQQAAMDVRAEEIMQAHLKTCPFVAAFGSEELDEMVMVKKDGKFSVFYDPLDGSSLLNVNFAVGTIVGVYEGAEIMGRTPREQVAAMGAVYGPRCSLMLSVGKGVHEFELVEGTWQLTMESVEMKNDKKYFAPGNLRATQSRPDYLELVNTFMKEKYTLRYSGGMVPDINHILKKGSGIFMYPGMEGMENGKLRLLYECGPLAMIVEQAGGASSDGERSILDVEVTDLVQRTPIYVGSPADVQRVQEFLR